MQHLKYSQAAILCLLVCLVLCISAVSFVVELFVFVFFVFVCLVFCVFVPEANTGLRAPLGYWHAAVLF